MITAIKIFIILICGYLLGSVSAAVIVSKAFYKSDVRTQGSHNAGSTNMARVFGMGAGFLTLAGDVLKTVLAMLIGRWLLGEMGFALGGIACIAGHCWPVFFNFKGGKAVAVSGGIAIMMGWHYALPLFAIFFLIAFFTRYVSLGSLISVVMVIPALLIYKDYGVWMYILSAVIIIAVWYMHRGNIKRLLTGTESKFTPGGKGKKH